MPHRSLHIDGSSERAKRLVSATSALSSENLDSKKLLGRKYRVANEIKPAVLPIRKESRGAECQKGKGYSLGKSTRRLEFSKSD